MADKPVALGQGVAGPSDRRRRSWFVDSFLGLGRFRYTALPAVYALVAVLSLGLASVALYSYEEARHGGLGIFSVALLVGLTALLAGGFVGFLFGIPKVASSRPATFQGNTNLVQVSDWITKILIGVGLTQVIQIPGQVHRLVAFLAPALGGQASSEVFALGLIGYFSISGFLIGYIATTLLMGHAQQLLEAEAVAPDAR